jgi:hypothetical protein
MSQTRSAPSENTGEDPVKPLLWVGTSRIAGRGLFTAQPIARGTRIIRYTGEKIPKAESDKRLAAGNVYIFHLNDRYDIDGQTCRNTARYINHACDPNCAAHLTTRTIWIVALRDITPGEELTYNYGYELDNAPAHPCTCGAETCCGAMVASRYQDVVRQRHATARGVERITGIRTPDQSCERSTGRRLSMRGDRSTPSGGGLCNMLQKAQPHDKLGPH